MAVSNFSRLIRQLHDWHPFPRGMLLYVDLRHMRTVNRLAPPGAADRVIEGVLAALRSWAGRHGFAERLWSNEFVAARMIDHGQAAIDEAAGLRDRLTAISYPSTLGSNHLAVSIGVMVVGDDADWNEAIGQAAEACQAAKRRGLNQIVSHAPTAAIEGPHVNAGYVLNFRQLMAEHRLALHPQPIMDIRGAQLRLAKAEFLLRIEEQGRFVPLPGATIATLEYFGLATELDQFSVEQVLSFIDQHPHALTRLDSISLNLSAKSIVDGHFMSHLLREVKSLHLPPGKLCFEITETAAMEHLDVAADVIRDFQAVGCRFSLDDFGSGLCSFGYLQRLAVDEIKIDGRFVREVNENAVSREIVRAIHHVAKAAGKTTVAEFVDSADKLDTLRDIGVDYAQGWLFHAAVPPERLLQLLSRAGVAERVEF